MPRRLLVVALVAALTGCKSIPINQHRSEPSYPTRNAATTYTQTRTGQVWYHHKAKP